AHIENAFPPVAKLGEKVELTLRGRNLPGGKLDPQAMVQGRPLDRLQVSFTAPRDPAALTRFDFINHPASPCLTFRGLQAWPEGLEKALNPVTLLYTDLPVTTEQEPNDTAEKAQALKLPTLLCGRFDRPGDADWYSFHLKAGQTIDFMLYCERMEMMGDPFLLITDAKGNELTSFDDHGINFNSLAQFNRDPVGTFQAPAD